MCLHSTASTTPRPHPCPAHQLAPDQRQHLALQALAGEQPIAHLAQQHLVSRKFVYQQADKAQHALQQAFDPTPDDQRVLFHLPVTKAWLRQFVLALVLICHSSLRGVVELLRDLFDYPLSIGSVFNILRQAVPAARAHNEAQDLAAVRLGAHDEIFQAGQPVLVGVCADSTYCYLLSLQQRRDAATWEARLRELTKRGFAPQATVADAAAGLRAGQAAALPDVPCRGDLFHVLYEAGAVLRALENRAYQAIATRSDLERKQAQHERRHGRKQQKLSQRLRYARPAEAKAIALAEEVALLLRWLREDILVVAGPDLATRQALYDFVVQQLQAREPQCAHRLEPLRRLLAHQRDDLLAFVQALERDLAGVATDLEVPLALVRAVLRVQALPADSPERWTQEAALRQQLRGRYHRVAQRVGQLTRRVVRASSLVENLNSRLRSYFFLRRQLGPEYLSLLQFFLNQRRFERSEKRERVGKSPAELLTGQSHPHWLELLGYTRFRRA
jgi:hypothetical protein